MEQRIDAMRATGRIAFGGSRDIALTEDDMILRPLTILPFHPNGMTLTAFGADGTELHRETYFSIGGGFVVTEAESREPARNSTAANRGLAFGSAKEMLELCNQHGCSVSDLMLRIERETRTTTEIHERLLHIRDVMVECEKRGIARDGYLPGSLRVRRRAKDWYERLNSEDPDRRPEFAEDWVNLVALAVNEENASGGRIVTAPTNGAAGIMPAVLHYAVHYTPAGKNDPRRHRHSFPADRRGRSARSTKNAPPSPEQKSAAKVKSARRPRWPRPASPKSSAAQPNRWRTPPRSPWNTVSGLTCDPIGGLVQIPCIERNAISAGKAINAARMALRGDGTHHVTPRPGHRDHAHDRRRHALQVQGNLHRRPRRQCSRQLRRMLTVMSALATPPQMDRETTMHLDWYDRGILTFVLDWAADAEPSDAESVTRFGIDAHRVMRRFDAVVDVFTTHQIPLEESDLTLVHQAALYRSNAHRGASVAAGTRTLAERAR